MKKKRGFTLVELLVVLIIIGIIVGLSYPALRQLRDKNVERKFTTYQDSLKSSAKLYADAYGDDIFGRKENGCICVLLSELEAKKVAKDININNVTCDTYNTFVRINKIDGNYTFSSYLGCKNKGQENISFIYPKSNNLHTFESEGCNTICTDEISTGMYINVSPNKDTKYTKKKTARLYIQSISGINQGIEIFYAWSTSRGGSEDLTNYKRLRVTAPADQKEKLANGEIITTQSTAINTPANKSGSYYLHIRVDRLYDLYDAAWSQGDGGKYLVFGPYNIDNDPPVINSHSVTSLSTNFNSTNPVFNMDVTDNITPKAKIEFCLSVESRVNSILYNYHLFHKNGGVERLKTTDIKVCAPSYVDTNKNLYYGKITQNMTLPGITTYSNAEVNYPIYVNAIDEAGNSTGLNESYKTSPQYTLTYNSNGGTSCNSKQVIKKKNGDTTWGELCKPTKTNYTFDGWYTSSNTAVTADTKVTGDLTVKAKWKKNKVIFRVKITSTDTLTARTSDSSATYNWTKDSNGFLNLNGKLYEKAYDFDATTIDLANYNNSSYIKISRTGYTGKSSAEWICASGCKTANQTFSQAKVTNYDLSKVCDYSKGNCIVNLQVNWRINVVKIKHRMNGGKLNTTNTAIKSSGDKILLNGSEVIQEVQYGKQTGSTGISNYNNSGYIKVEKNKYKVDKGYEWNTKADGSGTSYDQDKVYSASNFCDASNGDCEVILYVNWKKICTSIKLHKNDGTSSTAGPYTVCLTDSKKKLGYKADGTYRYSCAYGVNQFGCWNHNSGGKSFQGWSTSSSATKPTYYYDSLKYRAYWEVTDAFINSNTGKEVNLYAVYNTTRAYIYYSANGGTVRAKTKWDENATTTNGHKRTDAGVWKNWTTGTATIAGKSYSGLIYWKYHNQSSYRLNSDSVIYRGTHSADGDGLPDYDNDQHMYVTRSGYYAPAKKEWKCISTECNGNTYDQENGKYQSTAFCNNSKFDCSVVLAVNWKKK